MVQTVAILGASDKPERYSYLAFKMLQEYGHRTILISPQLKMKFNEFDKSPVLSEVSDIAQAIDTLTMYVGAEKSTLMQEKIIKLKPKRVIFNPGSENPALQISFIKAGIEVLEACTLVLLRTRNF